MDLTDFDEFFEAINGYSAFAWQRRLCEFVLTHGRWPESITAPTGSGKSNVVDVHVFAVAMSGLNRAPRVPRRLFVVVGRRALVDQHFEQAVKIKGKLLEADSGVLKRIREGLESLIARFDVNDPARDVAGEPLVLASLRGGVSPMSEWIADPRACAVVSATPDMWGSRLLFRGYGTSRAARPREAGLLGRDAVMVLDEAHLNRQLLRTARLVAHEGARWSDTLNVPELQVVEASATVDADLPLTVGVETRDLEDATSLLTKRLCRPKPVTLHLVEGPAAKGAREKLVAELCHRAESALTRAGKGSGTVGVIVNRVGTAIEVARRLSESTADDEKPHRVVSWVGRMRPMDLACVRDEHPNLFTPQGDHRVDFLVTTQTVEVGVDIDLVALVTELAPGTALVQRAGRVNRLGTRDSGPIDVVIHPTSEPLPYTHDDLEASRQWLIGRSQDPAGLAPWSLTKHKPPLQSVRRLVISDIQPSDWALLAETSAPHFAEPELGFWLRDEIGAESEPVDVVLRESIPVDVGSALELLRATPVAPIEVFPTTIAVARALVERVRAADTGRDLYVSRATELAQLTEGDRVRPGDTLFVDAVHQVAWRGVISQESLAAGEESQ